MGREIKRVPLNFDWQKDTVWKGYLNPHYESCEKCSCCDGGGYSEYARHLHDQWYGNAEFTPQSRGSTPFDAADVLDLAKRNVSQSPWYYGTGDVAIMRECIRLCDHFNKAWCHHVNAEDVNALIAADRLWDFTHDFIAGEGWKRKNPFVVPTAAQVNKWSLRGMGHDSLNAGIVIKAECDRNGEVTECQRCQGEGTLWPSESVKREYDEWNRVEPPMGEAYQLWETVSEGSPISPVFANPEDLADWLTSSSDYKWAKNDRGTTREQWLKFIVGPGWCPSLIIDSRGVLNGVAGVL